MINQERRILEEMVGTKKEESSAPAEKGGRSVSIVDGRGEPTRPLDVFWFFKPCTLSG